MACRRTFATPLRTVNTGVDQEPYDACPFCLSEVSQDAKTVVHMPSKVHAARKPEPQESKDAPSAPAECKKAFGYLGKRAANEQIPDECLTCAVIVQCMLKPEKGESR